MSKPLPIQPHQPTLLVVGGGTGGHLFPGVAIAEAWLRQYPSARVVFVGSPHGIEARVIPGLGYELVLLQTQRFKNAKAVERVRSLWLMPGTLWRARGVVARLRPDVVLGVGGFISGPVVLMAALSGVPCAVAEQNALPGLTNRLLSKVVRRVYTAFPEAEARLPRGKVRALGNPVRQVVCDAAARALVSDAVEGRPASRRVLVMGGSQGARALNERLPAALAQVARRFPELEVRHQAGRGNAESVRQAYDREGLPAARVEEFISDVAQALVDADLVVCRSGATTVAELACIGRAALFVPFPHAADDHQTLNAASLVSVGAACLLREADLTSERAATEVSALLEAPERLLEMARAARTRGRPGAASAIVDDLSTLLSRRAA